MYFLITHLIIVYEYDLEKGCKGAVRIMNLDKLNLIWWFDFRLETIFTTASVVSENATHNKTGQNDPKIIISLLLPRLSFNP